MLQSFLILQRSGTRTCTAVQRSASHPLPRCWAKPAIPLPSLSHWDNRKLDYCLGWPGKRGKKKSNTKKLKPEKHGQGVCTNAACVRKAVPSISNLPEKHPQQQQAPPAPGSLCPAEETRTRSQAAAFPGMSSTQLLPAQTHTLQSLQQLLGRRLGCVFFFFFPPSFYSSPPGRCCIYSSNGAARGRVPRSTAAWPMHPSWHRTAPGSH